MACPRPHLLLSWAMAGILLGLGYFGNGNQLGYMSYGSKCIRLSLPGRIGARNAVVRAKDVGDQSKERRIQGHDSKMSLKKRIRMVKQHKKAASIQDAHNGEGDTAPLKRTAFKKRKKQEALELSNEVNPIKDGKSYSLRDMYSDSTGKSILLVDGYNMLHLWPDLKNMLLQGEGAEAREHFVSRIGEFCTWRGIRARVVFDGKAEIPRGNVWGAIDVVYSEEIEADNLISSEILKLHMEDVHPVMVATNDQAVQISTVGYGAYPIPASIMVHEVETAYEEFQQVLREYNAEEAYLSKLPGDRAQWVEQMTLSFQQKQRLASCTNEERITILQKEEARQNKKIESYQGRMGAALNRESRKKLENLKKQLKNRDPKKVAQTKKPQKKIKKPYKEDEDREQELLQTERDSYQQLKTRVSRQSVCVSGCPVIMLNGVYEEEDEELLGRSHYSKQTPLSASGKLHLYYTQTQGIGRWVFAESVGAGYRAVIDSDELSPTVIENSSGWMVFNHTWQPAKIDIVDSSGGKSHRQRPSRY